MNNIEDYSPKVTQYQLTFYNKYNAYMSGTACTIAATNPYEAVERAAMYWYVKDEQKSRVICNAKFVQIDSMLTGLEYRIPFNSSFEVDE